MIRFTCGNCGRGFSVPEGFAGRRAKCKTCGAVLVVPATAPTAAAVAFGAAESAAEDPVASDASTAPAAVPTAMPEVPMRTQRLVADAERITEAFAHSELVQVRPVGGDPPELYEVEYAVRGLERGRGNRPVAREHHMVEIRLPADYPQTPPECKMLTPVFHPNIDPTAIAISDRWAANDRLVDLIVRIGEMLAYQSYDIQSPLDAEAAMWADLNATALPTDPRPLQPGEGRD